MSEKKAKKAAKDNRPPAEKLILDFLNLNKIVLIVDEIAIVNDVAKGAVYTVDKRPRIRAYYQDQVNKSKPNELKPTNGQEKKVEVVN